MRILRIIFGKIIFLLLPLLIHLSCIGCCYTITKCTNTVVDAFIVVAPPQMYINNLAQHLTIVNDNSCYLNEDVRVRKNLRHSPLTSMMMQDGALSSENININTNTNTNANTHLQNNEESIEELLESKLGLNQDQIDIVLQHQPRTMNLKNSILSSQQEINIKRIATASLVLNWFLFVATRGRGQGEIQGQKEIQAQGFTNSQVATIVMGHPPILTYDIETNLLPTIVFYNDALLQLKHLQRQKVNRNSSNIINRKSSNSDNNEDATADATTTDDSSIDSIVVDPITIDFLCKNPKLLEFNVNKRLKPRFEAYKKKIEIGTAQQKENNKQQQEDHDDRKIIEEILKTIVTKTDSRYEEWLKSLLPISEEEEAKEVEEKANNSYKQNNNQKYNDNIQQNPNVPSSYVILSNLQSGMNIGNILRSASIFGCTECIVVGQKRHRLTGDHGSRFDLPRRHFYTHTEAKAYLQTKARGREGYEANVKIYGVEIMENASPLMKYDAETGIVTFPFGNRRKNSNSGAAFVMGNEGLGLSDKQKEICDDFLYIPQTRGGASSASSTSVSLSSRSRDEQGNGRGSASLNVSCAAAIILQAYSVWANYPVAAIEGEKFVASNSK